ncbi:MAG TPA: bifunctional hydroxymethylpyrimidine kinase/phosphomethylpyrimidine kinase [Candidatus Methylacidiphilales bacterium]
MHRTVPVVLTIAGSDNSGGAGIQADLKTFTTLGVYGTTAVTCVVAEHPGRVLNITPIPPDRVADQIRLVLEAFPVAAIKTGMLYSAEIIAAVAATIKPALAQGVKLVVDPVMVASSGKVLMKKAAIRALRKFIAGATVVTPNRDEAELLWGKPIRNPKALTRAALDLAREFRYPHFLVKGGHLKADRAVDVLAFPEGNSREFGAKRIPEVDPHGTGCTYSAAIAAGLAKGLTVTESVVLGKIFITRALYRRFEIGEYQLLNQLP